AGAAERDGVIGITQLLDAEGVGPLAGLLAGVRHASGRGLGDVLTIPCDTPFLPPDLHQRLARGRPDHCAAAIPEVGVQLHPSCALWRSSIEPAILAYIADGRRSLIG